MNKFFAVAILALVAACAAAPTEDGTIINPVTETTGTDIAHGAEKRAILYRTPVVGSPYYYPGVSNYRYKFASPVSSLPYLSYPDAPYYGSYVI